MSDTQMSEKDIRMWGMICHLASFGSFVIPSLGHILGPLIVWLIKKDADPFIDQQGKESLNFQISVTIYLAISAVLCFIVIGFAMIPIIALADLILVIIAAVKTNSGENYRYPLTIRFLQ